MLIESRRATRIQGTNFSSIGRVEICHNKIWGVICADNWAAREAIVACHQLGYTESRPVLPWKLREWVKQGNYTTHGRRVEWLNNAYCHGLERKLEDCRHNRGRYRLSQRYGCVRRGCSSDQEVVAVNCSKKGNLKPRHKKGDSTEFFVLSLIPFLLP